MNTLTLEQALLSNDVHTLRQEITKREISIALSFNDNYTSSLKEEIKQLKARLIPLTNPQLSYMAIPGIE